MIDWLAIADRARSGTSLRLMDDGKGAVIYAKACLPDHNEPVVLSEVKVQLDPEDVAELVLRLQDYLLKYSVDKESM